MKTATTILFFASLLAGTTLKSQAIQDVQLTPYQCKIYYEGRFPFNAYRGLKGSKPEQWQIIRIHPQSFVTIIPLNDCGLGPHIVCPYELYIYSDNRMTGKIQLTGTKSYRIYWDPVQQWQIKEEKR